MIKKLCPIALAALLLLTLAAGEASSAGNENNAVEELLADFSSLMETREKMYSVLDEMYSALSAYAESGDYETLTQARIACSQTILQLRKMQAPSMRMTDDSILILMDQGVEVDGLEAEFYATKKAIQAQVKEAEQLEMTLREGVYQQSLLEDMKQRLNLNVKLLKSSASNDCFAINYLLFPLADNSSVQQFWSSLAAAWPHIGGTGNGWMQSQEDIVEKTITNQNEMINLVNDYETAKKGNAENKNGNSEPVQNLFSISDLADINIIKNMPTVIPAPEWNRQEAVSLWADTKADEKIPHSVTWAFHSVSSEDFIRYNGLLKSTCEENESLSGSNETGWKASYAVDGSVFSIRWEPDGSAFLTYDPTQMTVEAKWYSDYIR